MLAFQPTKIAALISFNPHDVKQSRTRDLQHLRKAICELSGQAMPMLEFNRDDEVNGQIVATVKWSGMKFRWRSWPHYNAMWPDIQAPILLRECERCHRIHESRAIHSLADLYYQQSLILICACQ
jgi:hypothetical protein